MGIDDPSEQETEREREGREVLRFDSKWVERIEGFDIYKPDNREE